MSNQLKNFIIGIFLISSVAVLVALVLFLKPSVGDEKQTLLVRFSNINKISVGTRVLFAGKPIGEVTDVQEIYHARETQPTDLLGRLFFYQLTLKIDSGVHVYSSDEISIQTSGLLGEKSIAIIPKSPPKGVIPKQITAKTPFYADSIDPIENTFSRLSDIGDKLDTTVDRVREWLAQNEGKLASSIASFSSAMAQVDALTTALNKDGLAGQIKEIATSASTSLQRIDTALTTLQSDRTFDNLGLAVANLQQASTSIDRVCNELSAGQGTVGKLIQNEDMYLRLTAILSKADTLMNDVNHYGILFHLNKAWQRTRAKRISALNALETPTAFKSYFQTEVDLINTSMARISMLIEKAKDDDQNTVLHSTAFKDNFADLLRHVDEVSDNLRLYNEQYTKDLKP